MDYSQPVKLIWVSILLILVIAAIGGLAWFFFFSENDGDRYDLQNEAQNEAGNSQPPDYGTELAALNGQPITFSTGNLLVRIFKKEYMPIDILPTPDYAKECNVEFLAGYLEGLSAKFQGEKATAYTVEYSSPTTGKIPYEIVLLPNKINYQTMAQFEKDFFSCGAGGIFPYKLNKDWLLFKSSCGGVNEECQALQDIIDPTIEFTTDQVGGVKTYANTFYGFEFTYSPNTFLQTAFEKNKVAFLDLAVGKNFNGADFFPVWIYVADKNDKEIINKIDSQFNDGTRGSISSNGMTWNTLSHHTIPIEGRGMTGSSYLAYTQKGDFMFLVNCVNCNTKILGKIGLENALVFENIFSTFKFTK